MSESIDISRLNCASPPAWREASCPPTDQQWPSDVVRCPQTMRFQQHGRAAHEATAQTRYGG